MKKMILVLMVVMTLGMIGAGLYTALATFDISQSATMAFTPADAYPCGMPNLVIEPCTDGPMF